MTHGLKSTETPKTKTDAIRPVEEKPSLPADNGSSRNDPPVFKDISNDESEESSSDDGRCAMVSLFREILLVVFYARIAQITVFS